MNVLTPLFDKPTSLKSKNEGFWKSESGQATIELMVVLPVAIALAVVVVNAMTFFSECAEFDRIARDAIRVYGTSPGYEEDSGWISGSIGAAISSQMQGPHLETSVQREGGNFYSTYVATLTYHPTLFGIPFRGSVFGVAIPGLTHHIKLTVDSYKPGILF